MLGGVSDYHWKTSARTFVRLAGHKDIKVVIKDCRILKEEVFNMLWEDVLKIMGATIFSLGGGAAIILGFSSWLGRVWADRILARQTHELTVKLEETKRDLDVIKETTLRFKNDKIITYRIVIDVIARILAALDAYEGNRLSAEQAAARFDEFNEQRLKVYGYLAMLAPQAVMDAQDNLMDYLLKISHKNADYEWAKVRELALVALNEMRADIGINDNPVSYNGDL